MESFLKDNALCKKLKNIGIIPDKLDPKQKPKSFIDFEEIDFRKLTYMVLVKRKMNTIA